MPSKRISRLNEQLRREIASLLHSQVRDPRVGPVSVTAVEVAADLMSARVFVRMLGTDAERAEGLEGLGAAAPFLRRTLGKMLHIRRVPELRFREDRSMEHAQRIESILHDVLPEEAEDEPEDGTEVDGAADAAPDAADAADADEDRGA